MIRQRSNTLRAPLVVVLAGVCAALHVGKLPPAIAALQLSLDVTLLQAGFLLSMVQLAGMSLGLALGALADGVGPKRSMLLGLLLLSVVSALGGAAQGVSLLMGMRALEGFGFLLVVLPAPGLIRQLVPPQRTSVMLGLWGTYMPFGVALALLVGPLWVAAFGWRAWWWALAALSLAMALWFARAVPVMRPRGATAKGVDPGWSQRLRQTLAARGPWLVGMTFAVYAGQWLAVIGFLPAIYLQAGVSGAATGVLTALAAAVNMLGNLAAGRWLQAGVKPTRLLRMGFCAMGLATVAAYAAVDDVALPAPLRYLAVLAFSMVGGLIPATLFALALRLAPSERTLSTTIGWVQQWSALGQFCGPPLVAWLASRAGGWQFTWVATGLCSLLGLLLATCIARLPRDQTQHGQAGVSKATMHDNG
jgi:MFS transporter, CP family, cyanate transporter